MPAVAMLHEVDPREDMLRRAGNLESVEVFGGDILVAIYKRPEKTKSGLILTSNTLSEDVHQGKVGLVLKIDRKSTRLNSSHSQQSRMPSSA